jgi:hypothetical protein
MSESRVNSRSLSATSMKKQASEPEVETKLTKCRSLHSFQNKIPFACKLVFSQGKLLHSNFEVLPKWFKRKQIKLKQEKTASIPQDKESLLTLEGFFKKEHRLNFEEPEEQMNLQNVPEIVGSSFGKLQGVKKMLGKKRASKPKKIFMRSKRNYTGFDIFESEDQILSFPNEATKILHRPLHDDDVDTDEDQMNQGTYKAFLNLIDGLEDLKQKAVQTHRARKCQSSSRKPLLFTKEDECVDAPTNEKNNLQESETQNDETDDKPEVCRQET